MRDCKDIMPTLEPSQADDQRRSSGPDTATLDFEAPGFAKHPEAASDLSNEILKMLPRARGEWLTCRRIGNSHYRCNWWGRRDSGSDENPLISGLQVTTHRVGRSEFIHATKTAGRLKMTMASGAAVSPMVLAEKNLQSSIERA